MKKTVRFLSIVLVFIMVATMLTSCGSKYPALQKAFKDKGYEENAKFTAIAEAVELHMLTKTDGLASVLIIEFKSTKELTEAYNKSNTMQGFVKDVQENEDVNKVYDELAKAGYACGNCLCLPLAILSVN